MPKRGHAVLNDRLPPVEPSSLFAEIDMHDQPRNISCVDVARKITGGLMLCDERGHTVAQREKRAAETALHDRVVGVRADLSRQFADYVPGQIRMQRPERVARAKDVLELSEQTRITRH